MEAKPFEIIRHRGDLQSATTQDGRTVKRSKSIYVQAYLAFVPCAPYAEHFIYKNDVANMPAHMCTCGSPAVVVDETNPGKRMFVCLQHASGGLHATGNTRWM